MPIWDDVVGETDRRIIAAAGYGSRNQLGASPVLVIVDTNYAFVGREPLPILAAIAARRTSCGERGWAAIPPLEQLIASARAADVPVIYTTGLPVGSKASLGRWAGKNARATEDVGENDDLDIVAEVAPLPGDLVIRKAKPSAFFGTHLLAHLIEIGADTIVVAGGTTSGCVRATAVDGFSYNFRVVVVEEGTFDRSEISHKVALFDLNAKYADVYSLSEAEEYFAGLE